MMPVNDASQSQEPQDMHFPGLARPLTRQETHVLDLLSQGYTNEDIAHALAIAVSTVSSHVQHILKKLQVRNRVEAVLYVRYHSAKTNSLHTTNSTSPHRTKSTRRSPLHLHDPLLFLSQLNHVNSHIALHGALHIDYFGMTGAVSLAFYDPYTQHLKVHITLCGSHTGELNVEIDELLWKYILEAVELSSDAPYPSSPQTQPVPASAETRIDTSE